MLNTNNDSKKGSHLDELDVIDIKAIVIQYLHFWPYFIGCIFIGLTGAYLANYFAHNIYQVNTTVQFKEQSNPFSDLTSTIKINNSKASEQTESNIIILKSYAHNLQVIKNLNLEVGYQKVAALKNITIFNGSPFTIIWDSNHVQIVNEPFHINMKEDGNLTISLEPKNNNISLYDYQNVKSYSVSAASQDFKVPAKFDEWIETPYLKFKIQRKIPEQLPVFTASKLQHQLPVGEYLATFHTYEQLVNHYQSGLSIKQITDEASIVELTLKGQNKGALVSYLNTSIEVFRANQLEEKNLMSINTIKFIDNEIEAVHDTLEYLQTELEVAQRENNLIDLSSQANFIYEKFSDIDEELSVQSAKLDYYHYLQKDLLTKKKSFKEVLPPAMAGITDRTLIEAVERLVSLNIEKSRLAQDLQASNPILVNLDIQMDNAIAYLGQTLSHIVKATEMQITNQQKNKSKLEAEFKTLPSAEQSILNIKRKHNVIDAQYTFLMEKRSEAGIAMAATVSDNKVIDVARDSGQAPISPKRKLNYIIGMMIGLIIPVGFLFLRDFFNNKIYTVQDIKNSIDAPVIGVVGHLTNLEMTSFQNEPVSNISESYRSLRTNCQEIMTKKLEIDSPTPIKNGQVILITSLMEGEGKSISSLNLALSYTNGGHKTVILAADLRRQNMHKRMNMDNGIGLADYLTGTETLDNIIQPTEIEHLDFISAGKKTRNPGELILSDKMKEIIDELKEKYDFVIIDTPPIGIVSDAKYLMAYSDLNLHVVRQGYTRLDLMENLNDLYKNAVLENYHILLNDVQSNSHNYGKNGNYGIAYSYGYSYGNKYGKEYYEQTK